MNNGSNDFDNLLTEFDADGMAFLNRTERAELDRLLSIEPQMNWDAVPCHVIELIVDTAERQGFGDIIPTTDLDIPDSLKQKLAHVYATREWIEDAEEFAQLIRWLETNQQRIEPTPPDLLHGCSRLRRPWKWRSLENLLQAMKRGPVGKDAGEAAQEVRELMMKSGSGSDPL